ncbi:hypothetical protein C2845_PM05G17510 [Panicum miliaceum]|uniref:Uncharacterized protein n=1 Tax=Panicum miliaceum TaxID=4540 RepID=A0A3L6T509_PANMI|nr:hypothetical protein C2845_PM05G17510 [Panicum miliaceum]
MLQLLRFTRHHQQRKAHGNRREKDRCISSPTTSGSPQASPPSPCPCTKAYAPRLFYCHSPERDKA